MEWLAHSQKVISLIAPFFAFVMYETPIYINKEGPAFTRGYDINMPEDPVSHYGGLPQATAIYLHELMHVTLFHVQRMGGKHPYVWNIATDVVVNGAIQKNAYSQLQLPSGVVRMSHLEHLSAEEVYNKLVEILNDEDPSIMKGAGGKESVSHSEKSKINRILGLGEPDESYESDLRNDGSMDKQKENEVRSNVAKARNTAYGTLDGNLQREVKAVLSDTIDWESLLSRYLTKYADDYSFSVFDRRFEDFYIPEITGEKIKGRVEVDTSGSISSEQLSKYLGQIISLISTFESVELTVSLFHVKSYAEYSVESARDLEKIEIHSGGTSFVDSLVKAEKEEADFVIFLTDLYGEFPSRPPKHTAVIWLSDGGDLAPFGTVIKLRDK